MTEPSSRLFARRVLVAAGLVALLAVGVWLLGKIAHILLLIFAAILFTLLLDGLARATRNSLHVPDGWALAMVCVALLALTAGFVWLAGPQVSEQLGEMRDRLPRAVDRVTAELRRVSWLQSLMQQMPPPGQMASGALGGVMGVFSTVFGVLTGALAVLVIGVYAAAQPRLYYEPMLRLVPPRHRDRGRKILADLGHALQSWLVGRFTAMAVVGVLTWIGLMLIGLPLALTLGIIAGLLAFIPFIGPIISVVPALLIGLLEGPATALSVAVVYGVVQLLESNLITPIIEQKVVHIPPAALLSAQLVMGVLFGIVGVLLSTPFFVVIVVLVQTLYLQDVLDDDEVTVLGDNGS